MLLAERWCLAAVDIERRLCGAGLTLANSVVNVNHAVLGVLLAVHPSTTLNLGCLVQESCEQLLLRMLTMSCLACCLQYAGVLLKYIL